MDAKMAEGRMLKKEISDSKKLGRLKSDRPRVLYFMMYPHLDRDGRLKADPHQLKGQVCTMLPYSAASIQKSLEQLHEVGLLVLYQIDGDQYVQISRFNDFQTFNYDRESKSKIPPPTQDNSRVVRRTPLKLREIKRSKEKRSKGKFIPPTLEDVKKYISDNPELSNIDPNTFWKGFNDGGWIDTRGNPVRNWKLKLRTWSNYGNNKKKGQRTADRSNTFAEQESNIGKTIK